MARLFAKYVIVLAMMVLSFLYMPMNASLLSVFACKRITCALGEEFVFRSVSLDIRSVTADYTLTKFNRSACSSCFFDDASCPIASALCPQVEDLRLAADPSLSCTAEMWPYYLPGTILMLGAATVGIPYLVYKLITVACRYVTQIPVEGPTRNMKWALLSHLSQNSCRSLYNMFSFRWRFYNILLTTDKLIVALITTVATYIATVSAVWLAAHQTVVACFNAGARPYLSRHENAINVSLRLLTAGNFVVAALVKVGFGVPARLQQAMVGVNGGLVGASAVYALARVYVQSKYFETVKLRRTGPPVTSADAGSKPTAAAREADIAELQEPEESRVRREIEKFVAALDTQLNTVLLKNIVNFVLVMGIASFLAICCSVIGLVVNVSRGDVIAAVATMKTPPASKALLYQYEFAGYGSWEGFSANCCCENRSLKPSASALVYKDDGIMELWKCLDPSKTGSYLYKERLRAVSMTNGPDGRLVRAYCGKTFNPTVACNNLTYDEITERIVVAPCGNVTIQDTILTDLW